MFLLQRDKKKSRVQGEYSLLIGKHRVAPPSCLYEYATLFIEQQGHKFRKFVLYSTGFDLLLLFFLLYFSVCCNKSIFWGEIMKTNELLQSILDKGFTLDTISIATQISIETLTEILKDKYKPNGYDAKFIYLNVFLMQLSHRIPLNNNYFSEIVDALCDDFKMTSESLAQYIGITGNELKEFLSTPDLCSKRRQIELMIMHLFTTLIRDSRFSVD